MSKTYDWLGLNKGDYGTKPGEFAEVVIEELIERYISKGDIAIDCGAADGRMLKLMLNAVGADGAAVAFEPIPHIFDRLDSLYTGSNVFLFNVCVSDAVKDGVTFYHAKDRRWISSLSPNNLKGYDVEELVVPVTTLSLTVAGQKALCGKSVGFIKLDIEGAEFSALKGGAELISKDKPFIVFENGLVGGSKAFGYTKEDFFEFFNKLDYRLFDVFGTPLTTDLWESVGKKLCWNFVACHKDDPRLDDFVESLEVILLRSLDSMSPAPRSFLRS